MSSGHPSYEHPTIVEALCEVHFRLDKDWQPSLPGELFKHIQNDYPNMEPVSEMGLQVALGPQGMVQQIMPPRQRTRFRHATRPLMVQLGEDILTVNTLEPYSGWQVMEQDVMEAWGRAREALQPTAIQRVGLRYINRIPCDTKRDRLAEWLKAGRYIPSGVTESQPGFLLRVQVSIDAENRLVVTLADTNTEDGGAGGVVFDIDRIVEHEMQPDEETLRQEMCRLHDSVWDVFSSAAHGKLQQFLEGGTS